MLRAYGRGVRELERGGRREEKEELLPLRRYTTEYGNTLERVSKHKAVLAGTIELPIATDEVGFDELVARLALEPAAGRTPQAAERMAA